MMMVSVMVMMVMVMRVMMRVMMRMMMLMKSVQFRVIEVEQKIYCFYILKSKKTEHFPAKKRVFFFFLKACLFSNMESHRK